MFRFGRPLGFAGAALLVACGEPDDGSRGGDDGADGPVPLLDHELWEDIVVDDDPFPDHRPDEVTCTGFGLHLEDGLLEVETQDCNYASVEQPLPAAIEVGDQLDLLVSYGALAALEPTEAHLALVVGNAVLWEKYVPIPGNAGLFDETWAATVGAEAGERIAFHLHNHGTNAWRLHELVLTPAP